ncbi:hypothetical protein H4R24_004000 [Coemansia sp. RSA 988]|nr:hypothetical protein H4R24_004000 [Coemansia sp. RSA 988]
MSTEDQALPPKRDNEPLVTRPGGRPPRNRPKPAPTNRNSPAATVESVDAKKPRRRGPKNSVAAASATQPNNAPRNGPEPSAARPRPPKPNAAAASSAKGKSVRPPVHVSDSSNAGGSAPKPRSKPNKPRPASSAAQGHSAEDAAAGKPRAQARPRRRQNSTKPGAAGPSAPVSTVAPAKQPPVPKILQRNPPKPKEQLRQQARPQPKPKPTAKHKTKLPAEPKSPATPVGSVPSLTTAEMRGAAAIEAAVADMPVASAEIPASRPSPVSRSKPIHRSVKLCIRWLPADLPEHVLWRAIESALPWFDAACIGSVAQRTRFVLTALLPGHDQPQGDTDASKAAEPIEEDEGSEDTMTPQEHIATEGATTAVPQSYYESENLARLDCAPYWRRFVAGKQHANKAKPAEPSRAYIAFASEAEAGHFYRRFHGHVFGREGGVQWRARVEQAAFQSLPAEEHAVTDPLEGTIDADPDFMAFLDPLVQQKPQPHASYAAAVSGPDEKVTPLIRYLRELKAKKNLPQSKAAGKKAKLAPQQQQQQQKESMKKQRRGNR